MTVAQMAADAIAAALSKTMGKDPGIPPIGKGSIGALLVGHPTVLIGGFPMVDIPNPIDLLLDKLGRFTAQSPKEEEPEEEEEPTVCPIPPRPQ